jgi:hypothetical protein
MSDVDSFMPEVEDVPETQAPDVVVDTTPPEDKAPAARDESGKFTPKEGKKEDKGEADLKAQEPKAESKQEQRSIPLAAHLEERRAFRAELDAMKRELEAFKNPPKAPPPTPEFTEDPKAYVDHRVQSALEKLEGQTKQIEQVQQTAQQATQQSEAVQFSQTLQAAEAAFVKETPDYYDALGHVREVRVNQLKLLAPGITDDQIVAQIRQEEFGMAQQLARAGRNPIQTVYELARAYGYQKKAAPPPANVTQLPNVPGPKQLPPDQTLGTGDGGGTQEVDAQNSDPFADAFAEMFGKKKSA